MRGLVRALLVSGIFAAAGCKEEPTTPTRTVIDLSTSATLPQTRPLPGSIEIVEKNDDLGDADYGQIKQAVFTVRNNSADTVTLAVLRKSCGCAGVRFDPDVVLPGQAAKVYLSWTPKADKEAGSQVEVDALVGARADGQQVGSVKLVARGTVKPVLTVRKEGGDIEKLTLADLKQGKASRTILVTTEHLERKDFTLQATTTDPGVKLEVEKLSPVGSLVGGYRVKVLFREGLAAGRFRTLVVLKTDVYDFPLEVPFEGVVEIGGVSVRPAFIALNDPHPLGKDFFITVEVGLRDVEQRQLAFVSAEPGFFQVVEIRPDAAARNVWRVRIRLPGEPDEMKKFLKPGEKIEDYLTGGIRDAGIVLKTNSPDAPVIRIPIQDVDFEMPK